MSDLRAFLADPARPEGTFSYHELQGFLFAVACVPELVPPSGWLPCVFNDKEPGFPTSADAEAVLQQLMAIYNDVVASATADRPALPRDCEVREGALDNLDPDAPLSGWCRGFAAGHEWLGDFWEIELPNELDRELGAAMMTLSFFSSRSLAEAMHRETASEQPLDHMAANLLELFPEALASYAYFGRSVIGRPLHTTKVGRNEACPCGSGKKYKRCCGA